MPCALLFRQKMLSLQTETHAVPSVERAQIKYKSLMHNKTLWQRLRFKYRISVLNESTLTEEWHIRLSRIGVFLLSTLLLAVTFALLAVAIWFTPLRNYLPGYNENIRQELVVEMMRVDSLQRELTMQSAYIASVRKVLAGETEHDSLPPVNSILRFPMTLLEAENTAVTEEFLTEYEEYEKDNLTLFDAGPAVTLYVFFRPAHGVVTEHYAPAEGRYGTSIRTPENENVTCVLDGTVLYTGFTLAHKHTLIVQHEDGYVSVYRNLRALLRQKGDVVQAGESIAIADSEMPLLFELWQKGAPVNPEEVISF